MAYQRLATTDRLWSSWSYSKMRALYTCPLQFWFQYIEKIKVPKPVILVVGAAIHYMAKRFFRVNFASAKSFAGAWKGYWIGIVNKKHGPDGYNSESEEIAWRHDSDWRYWINRGQEILIKFYDRNESRRMPKDGTVIGALVERRFRTSWRSFTLNGVIDRIDEYPDYVEVLDYKLGTDPLILIQSSLQQIFYQIGYENNLMYQKFDGKPLKRTIIENLQSGQPQVLEPANTEKITDFANYLGEVSTYVRAILTGRKPHLLEPAIVHFNARDVTDRVFYPRFPRGFHCKNCSYMPRCREWEEAHIEPSHDRFMELRTKALSSAMPRQTRLPFVS